MHIGSVSSHPFCDFCTVDFITLVFRLGVVLAIFSFIWGILKLVLALLRGGIPMSYPLSTFLKLFQYLIITDIALLFCYEKTEVRSLDLVLTGFILLLYFLGKVQNSKLKFMMVQLQGRNLNPVEAPKMVVEFSLVALSLLVYIVLAFNDQYIRNPISSWFFTNIIDIENTPIFGFIFNVIGFFFTIAILVRIVNSFTMLISGKAFEKKPPSDSDNTTDSNKFDDYEEVK